MSEDISEQPEFGSSPGDLQQFNLAVRDYLAHNDKYWFGAVLGRAFDKRAEKQKRLESLIVDEGYTPDEAREKLEEDSEVSPEDEAEMAQGVLEAISSGVFNRIGLKLVGRNGRDVIRLPEDEFQPIELHFGGEPESEEDHVVKEVGIRLSNGHDFVNFLRRINPEEVNWLFAHNLNKVCWSILWGLSESVRRGEETPDVHEALAYAASIADATDRLNMANKSFGLHWNDVDLYYEKYPLEDPAPRFRTYDYWNRQGVLAEYMIGEEALFFKEGKYEFLRLLDHDPERVGHFCGIYLRILRKTKANPRGKELFDLMLASINQKIDNLYSFVEEKKERARRFDGEEGVRGIMDYFGPTSDVCAKFKEEVNELSKGS